MKLIKYHITINGVKAGMLFTPRLFEYKTASMDFSDAGSATKVVGMYADLMYCAALNYWTLEERHVEDFQLKRMDFHEWAQIDPQEFAKVMKVAVEAITNKSLDELTQEQKNDSASADEVKKKNSKSIIQRLKNFLLGIAK